MSVVDAVSHSALFVAALLFANVYAAGRKGGNGRISSRKKTCDYTYNNRSHQKFEFVFDATIKSRKEGILKKKKNINK